MNPAYINLTPENCDTQHVCCAISDKNYQEGVQTKRAWLMARMTEGHTFRKLDENGKVFKKVVYCNSILVNIHALVLFFIN